MLLSRWRATIAGIAALAAGGAAWADNTAVEAAPKLHLGWLERDLKLTWEARAQHPDLIVVGDSIVERFEQAGKPVWDRYYAPRNALNLGIGGDRTEQVLWRLEHGNLAGMDPKLAIVMIGQNNGGHNSAPEIAEGIAAVVRTLQARLPRTRILLLAIFPRGPANTPERAVLAEASSRAARLADNQRVFYLDVDRVFLRPDATIPAALMADSEHPTALGYERWAEAIEPTVARLMGDAPRTVPDRSAIARR
jgi:lysophospholipase L1-like esterase